MVDEFEAEESTAWRSDGEYHPPGERHAHILFGFLQALGTAGNLTTDAHLASLAVEYRAELASTDSAFARFAGLRWVNPFIDR